MSDSERVTLRLGLDDTDHPEGGCTTYDLNELSKLITCNIGSAVEIERRLVRLWPFAERRTRGNAALCLLISINSRDVEALYETLHNWIPEPDTSEIANASRPAIVVGKGSAPASWYWETVRGYVDLDDRLSSIEASDYRVITHSDRPHGAIGASAAVAWPASDFTWELVAWRYPNRIGSPRAVDAELIGSISVKHPGTFANRDPTTGRCLIAPRTPCPVLYGIRGLNESSVIEAHSDLQAHDSIEDSIEYGIHRTNQCSDDHLENMFVGTVTSEPVIGPGGHVSLTTMSRGRLETIVAFKEGGPVNAEVRSMHVGDIIRWVGLRSSDDSIHLERVCLIDPVPVIKNRPKCCGSAMKSEGKRSVLRCSKCDKKRKRSWVSKPLRNVGIWAEPPPSHRRHIAKPLSEGPPDITARMPPEMAC